jgi:xanthine/CO dehydrogenase XdhC/CoxF family maturation factor
VCPSSFFCPELEGRQGLVTASVVRFQAPISGKPVDKAIIFADGKMWGWIGGGCAQPVVIKEALKAFADGKPRLVRISPHAARFEAGVDSMRLKLVQYVPQPMQGVSDDQGRGQAQAWRRLSRLIVTKAATTAVSTPHDVATPK